MENDQRTISFEFFPPKNEQAAERLAQTSAELAELEPEFFSVTFGAGGSTRSNTLECVSSINSNTGIDVAPHLSCIGSTEESIRELLEVYQSQGIKRIVALRGDMPSGMRDPGELNHANELVEFIRKTTGDHFHIEVAAYPEFHPQARSAQEDVANFKRKVEAGANSALTQYFFNSDAYFRFLDDCSAAGINIPIVPGIMPITNYIQLARFSDACGAEIPRWIRRRLEGFGDDIESLRAFGTDIMTELCATLLEGDAPGLHFYTMNQTRATLAIWQQLQG
ncbi:MAG: methylenetetrahydrofolate reductase [NAD(P)H] [Gammaproteobacteria bacterium]|nr:methylenetetrahydrofolate reductase [NAD(P)H] [Gammaproteobacteria bacterium]PCH63844.1 MAG: methylenetetrahydrofolate reductase [NAD(P)H] [Gammaproteobacteria bacterium]PCH63975.1 MAG: methylenetetrahydrofolate reductase [NAD(P)H] [Gammaproteobacteria bacterium]